MPIPHLTAAGAQPGSAPRRHADGPSRDSRRGRVGPARALVLAAGAVLLPTCTTAPSRTHTPTDVCAKPAYAQAHWGIHVEDMATGELVIGMHSDRLFAPASNTKLFSVAAAFEEFGAQHRFETLLQRNGEVEAGGSLKGDLVLRPMGDLTLGGRDDGHGGVAVSNSDHIYAVGNPNTQLTAPSPLAGLERLAAAVRSSSITSVDDVVVDDRLFQPSSSTGSGPTTVTPIVVNDNLVDFVIRPTTRGAPAVVEFRPASPLYVVDSRVVTTGEGPYGVRIQSPRPGHFVLVGTIPVKHPPQIEVHEVTDPAANARQLLIEALQRAGIVVRASAADPNPRHRLPESSELLPVVGRLQSAPFAEEARLILKVSHNLHASTLPLLIAVRHGARDLESGLEIQGKLLRKLGVDTDKISFGGAAGGSRADMATPRVIVQLLRAVAARPYAEAFLRALPVLGVDGTLFQTCTQSPARGKVHAKTGTYTVYDQMNKRALLTSKALGGYMTARSGRRLAFSIVVNNVFLDDATTITAIGEDLAAIAAAIQQAL